jgi:hypothetical protein
VHRIPHPQLTFAAQSISVLSYDFIIISLSKAMSRWSTIVRQERGNGNLSFTTHQHKGVLCGANKVENGDGKIKDDCYANITDSGGNFFWVLFDCINGPSMRTC